jgi:Ca-activated chloride channel family protein
MRLSAMLAGVAILVRLPIGQPAAPDTSVVLHVTVTDPNQRIVGDLTKDDFEIYDNGRVQTVTAFDVSPRPLNVVVMLDTSGSMAAARGVIESAIRGADELLTRLSGEDKALVGSFNDKITFQPAGGFTGSVELLRNGLRHLPVGYPTRLYDALGETIERLEATQGRRAVVILTDGDDNSSRLGAGEIQKRARIADVAIYGLGIVNQYFNGQERVRTRPGRDLKNLCAESGGVMPVLKDSTEWGPAFARLAEELHSQYVISFSPQVLDRKVHKLEVKVKRPGLSARARKSYTSSAASKTSRRSTLKVLTLADHTRGCGDQSRTVPCLPTIRQHRDVL